MWDSAHVAHTILNAMTRDELRLWDALLCHRSDSHTVVRSAGPY